jgi:type II secretory pathway component PulF
LDLLESGCSREEIETAIGKTLHDEKTVARFIQKKRMTLFRQSEQRFGFGFALLLCLQLRLRKAQETNNLLRTLAYPMVLIVSGYCVLAMYLFVIAVTIEANRTLFQTGTPIPLRYLQSLFIIFSLLILILSILLLYRLATRPQRIFIKLSAAFPNNPWSIALSRKMAFHIAKLHTLGLSTRDICLTLSNFPKEPILAAIASSMLDELTAGNSLQASLVSLDPFLIRILRIESHPDFAARLRGYDDIARKRYEYSVKKMGYIVSICAYLFISVLIFTLYKEIMAPLDMLKNMG